MRIVTAWSRAPDTSNYGTIILRGGDDAEGFRVGDGSYNFFNSAGAILDISADRAAYGLYLDNGGSIVNDGHISAHIFGGYAFPDAENARAILIGFGNHASFSLNNTGVIEASGTSPDQIVEAIYINADGSSSIINSGTIRGTYAISQQDLGRSALGNVLIENSGLLEGHVALARGNDVLSNSGRIAGNVDLGAGNDTYDGAAGTVDGPVHGGDGDDDLTGGDGDETLAGGHGNDALDGGLGNDTAIFSGLESAYTISEIAAGVFQVVGQDGADTLTNIEFVRFDDITVTLRSTMPTEISGSDGADLLSGTANADEIYGLGGNDNIEGGEGDDTIDGGAGWDMASYGSAAAGVTVSLRLQGTFQDTNGAGLDRLIRIENLSGSNFDDMLTGRDTASQLWGLDGNDLLHGGSGNDRLDGGRGADVASYRLAVAGVTVSLASLGIAQNTMGAGNDTLVGIESLIGSNFDDTLTGNQQNNALTGNDGDDALWGGGGRDILSGGMGDDLLHAGGGIDTVSYENAAAGVIVTLSRQGIAQNTVGDGVDTLVSVENLTGSGFDDRLFGDGGANTLEGRAGNDFLDGRDGADALSGGAGDDRLLGGNGDDVLDGGDGADALLGGAGIDTLRGGTGNDQYYLDTAADLVFEAAGEGIDSVFAGFDYTLPDNVEAMRLLAGTWNGTGNALDNSLFGSAGANTLLGLDGDDRLFGEGGPDVLDGGAGNDRLFGGAGRDTMTGGSGADRFVFGSTEDLGDSYAAADIITDFDGTAGDRIHLVGIDAIAGTVQDDAFAFIGSDAFSGTAGELRYFSNRNGTFIEMDTDGDGLSDFAIRLEGQIDLTASDFFL